MSCSIEDLRRIGLSDEEIAVLAHTYEGRSRPLIAEMMHVSSGTVANWYYSAKKKLAMHGLTCPKPGRGRPVGGMLVMRKSIKTRYMDPVLMDRIYNDGDRYNA